MIEPVSVPPNSTGIQPLRIAAKPANPKRAIVKTLGSDNQRDMGKRSGNVVEPHAAGSVSMGRCCNSPQRALDRAKSSRDEEIRPRDSGPGRQDNLGKSRALLKHRLGNLAKDYRLGTVSI